MSVAIISDIINDLISVIVSHTENKTSTYTSRRDIFPQAKLVLADYFDRCNFPSNKTFPCHSSPGDKKMDVIIARFGLKRTQDARQLLIWKQSKYKIDDHIFTMSSESISSRITDRLTISPDEKIYQTLLIMIPSSKMKKENSRSYKFTLAQSSAKMNAYLRQIVSYLFVDNDI